MKHTLLYSLLALVSFSFGCGSDSKSEANDVEQACQWFVLHTGSDGIKINWDLSKGTGADMQQKARVLCAEELNGLPFCKDEIIAFGQCEYDESTHPDRRYNEDPCKQESIDRGECLNGLSEADKQQYNTYIDNYAQKYSEL